MAARSLGFEPMALVLLCNALPAELQEHNVHETTYVTVIGNISASLSKSTVRLLIVPSEMKRRKAGFVSIH